MNDPEYEYTVTCIEPVQKGRNRVYINDEFAFVLYDRELRCEHIETGTVLSAGRYELILNDIVGKRAYNRALTILERADKSSTELARKLTEDMYPEDVIRKVMSSLEALHYVDDRRLAENYIRSGSGRYSRYELRNRLLLKGITADVISDAFEQTDAEREETERIAAERGVAGSDSGEDAELTAALGAVRRKLAGRPLCDREQREKVTAYLQRKGFSYGTIRTALERYEEDTAD